MKRILIILIAVLLVMVMVPIGSGCKATTAETTAAATTAAAETTVAATTAAETTAAEEEIPGKVELESYKVLLEENPKYGGIFKYGLTMEPDQLDNHLANLQSTFFCGDPMNGFLWRWLPDMSGYISELATNVVWQNEEKTVILIELRDDVTFHNGEKLTAEDVKASLDRAISDESIHKTNLSEVDRIEIVDDYSIKVFFKKFGAGFLDYIPKIAIYPKSIIENDVESLKTNPIGCGPFEFVEWQRGYKIVLKKFDNYFREDLPYLDGMEIIFFADSATLTYAIENGEIDMVTDVGIDQITVIPKDNPNIEPYFDPIMGMAWIGINMADPLFKDNKDLRYAIRYAIDPRVFAANMSVKENDPVLTFAQADPRLANPKWEWDESWYDIEKAKQFLEDAGYPNGEGLPAIDIIVPDTPFEDYMGDLAQAQLAEIGINLNVFVLPVPEYITRAIAGEYGLNCCGDTHDVDPGVKITQYFTPGGAIEWGSFYTYNQELIDKIGEQAIETNREKRLQLIRECWDISLEEMPIIWLHKRPNNELRWNYVENYIGIPNTIFYLIYIHLDK